MWWERVGSGRGGGRKALEGGGLGEKFGAGGGRHGDGILEEVVVRDSYGGEWWFKLLMF